MGFETQEQVVAWAESHGGESGLNTALAQGLFGSDMRTINLAKNWLSELERKRREKLQDESLEAAVRSAAASEQSARATKWAAIAAAIGAGATLLAALIPLFTTPSEHQSKFPTTSPIPALPKAESSPPLKPTATPHP